MEDTEMSTILKQLKLTAVPSGSNPVMDRRMSVIRRLEEQKQLSSDPQYVRVTTRWTGKGEARHQVEKTQRVLPWWKELPDGGQGRHRCALAGQGAGGDRDAGCRSPSGRARPGDRGVSA